MRLKRDILVITAGFGLVLALGSVGAGVLEAVAKTPDTKAARLGYVSAPLLEVVGPTPSHGEAAEEYRALVAQSAYHAAFAIGPGEAYGWSENYATQETADAAALAWCRGEEGVEGCEIVARIRPAEMIEIDGQPLSKTVALGANEYLAQMSYKAFAMSDLGDWGGAWGYDSQAAAAAQALEYCRSYLDHDVPGLELRGTCRIVWTD